MRIDHLYQRSTPYTESRFLPLARLELMTLRPFFVDIRLRKPCVRLRLITLG